MSLIGRAANLVRGGLAALGSGREPTDAERDPAVRAELDERLGSAGDDPPAEPPERAAPERDAQGNVKRTL